MSRYESDHLTHFVGQHLSSDEQRFDLLLKILSERQLRGSGRNIISPKGKISSGEMFDSDVVCFCDIPLSGLTIHMEKYSRFGLAFEKTHLTRRGASPIFYVARGSTVLVDGARITRGEYLDKMGPRTLALLDDGAAQEMEEVHPLKATVNGEPVYGPILTARSDAPHVSVNHFMITEMLGFVKVFDETLSISHRDNY